MSGEHDDGGVGAEYRLARQTVMGTAAATGVLGGLTTFMGWITVARGDYLGGVFLALALVLAGISVGWLRRLWRDEPDLALSEEGIVDRSHIGPPIVIPWSAIRAVREEAGVTVAVLDDDHTVAIPRHRRVVQRLLRRSRAEHLLPTAGMDVPAPEISRRIRDHHERLLLDEVRSAARRLDTPPESPRPDFA